MNSNLIQDLETAIYIAYHEQNPRSKIVLDLKALVSSAKVSKYPIMALRLILKRYI